jgi:hypothetical protein
MCPNYNNLFLGQYPRRPLVPFRRSQNYHPRLDKFKQSHYAESNFSSIDRETQAKLAHSHQGKANLDPLKAAGDTFISSLSPQDRRLFPPYASLADLTDDIRKVDAIASFKIHEKMILDFIGRFSSQVEPYFKVVEIFVSSNSQHAALFWGALRLIFQVS